MGRIKTHNVKRMLSILLTLCMMLTLIPALPVHAETNPGTTSVIINGQTLNTTKGYLVYGEAKMNAVLGAAGCTAYFDGNGTLTLYGYTGSRIRVSESNRDMTIILMGNKNTITENGSGEKIGISLHSGNLHINAVNAARLTMNLFSNDNNAIINLLIN